MKRTAALFTAVSIALAAAGCSSPPRSEPLTMTGVYFDTVVEVQVWGGDQDILDHCDEICAHYEQMLSPTIEDSEVFAINRAAGTPTEVSEETADLIKAGLEYGNISGGMFDITIASASSLWNFTDNEDKSIPDAAALAEAVTHIDYR